MTSSTRLVPPPALRTDLSRPVRWGVIASLLLLVLAGLWAQQAMIGGAVIAQGQVVVRGKPKQVQSLDGGVVEAILVKNGDVVQDGDPLIRLDPTLLRVNLDIYRNRLAEALIRQSRLQAEQLSLDTPLFDYDHSYLAGMELGRIEEGQRQIFTARLEVLHGRKEQLAETIEQIRSQIRGSDAQAAALSDQLGYIEKELQSTLTLSERGLTRESQVLELQRARASLLGEIAAQQAESARLATAIRDTELESLQAEREFKEQVVTELREVTTEAEELVLQIVNTEKQLSRIELRAPASGIVHELQATTVGGVIAPGATVVQVIPLGEGVEFELRIDPRSIDEVFLGQRAKVVLPAFRSRTTPDIFGTVSTISPSSVTDPATGQSFYRLQLAISAEELAKLGTVELVPGMPVEAFLQTGERSALDYLVRPLAEQVERAFRDN